MKDYTLKINKKNGKTEISFPYYGMYITNATIDHGKVIYPCRIRRKANKVVLDASGNPIRDLVYHPMAAFQDGFEDWLRDVAVMGHASTVNLDSPGIQAFVTPRSFGSDLIAFVCLSYHGLIIDDFALKKDENGLLYLTMPHRTRFDENGVRHDVNLVEITDPNEYNRLMDLILDKYQIA